MILMLCAYVESDLSAMIERRILAVISRSVAFIFCWSAVASPGFWSRLFTEVLSGFVLASVDCAWMGPTQDRPSNRAKVIRFVLVIWKRCIRVASACGGPVCKAETIRLVTYD